MDLLGSRVLVTGASRGIGAALVECFVAAGAVLALVARDQPTLTSQARRIGAKAYVADLADPADVAGLITRVEADGPIDVLVNNAGVEATASFVGQEASTVDTVFRVNLLAPVELCRQVLPLMLNRRRGHIVNISSLSGVSAFPGLTTYGASKAGLSHFTAGLRADLRGQPICTTLVQIGPVATDMIEALKRYPPTRRSFDQLYRMRRLRDLTPAEVAEATVDAVAHGKRHVRLPRLASVAPRLTETPRWVVERLLAGVRHESIP